MGRPKGPALFKQCERCGDTFSPSPGTTRSIFRKLRFCSRKCSNSRPRREPQAADVADRFWSRVERGNGCWIWTGGLSSNGYGSFGARRASISAHRFSYELTKGPIPEGMLLMHSCDNPRCVNPDHLTPGTNADNMLDMVTKRRNGDRPAPARPRYKLDEGAVRAIRASTKSNAELARDYGVARTTVSMARSGKNWASA